MTVLKEEIIIDLMTEILTEEETTVTDLKEENNKDMNQEEKNTEKELQFNGLKSMKSVQEMTDSILLSRSSLKNSLKVETETWSDAHSEIKLVLLRPSLMTPQPLELENQLLCSIVKLE